MPDFTYTALTADGVERRGSLRAGGLEDARRQLRGMSLMPLSMDLESGEDKAGKRSRLSLRRRLWVRQRDIQFMFRQLALLIGSGHRVRQSLEICAGIVERDRLAAALKRMVERLDGGMSFADALAKEPKYFPPYVPALIHAGEQSGALDRVLNEISAALESAHELRNAMLRALLFPVFTLIVAIGILCLIVFWLVPRLLEFLTRNRAEIHWSMQSLIDFTEFAVDYGPPTLIALIAFTVIARIAYATNAGRLFEDRILLSTPIFGPTLRLVEMSQFGAIGAMLALSGLRQVEVLRILARVTQNRFYAKLYLDAADALLTGAAMSKSITNAVIPPLVPHMLAIGEVTGGMDEVLRRIGRFYADEVETRIRVLISTMVPAITISVGVIVAIIYLSLLLTVLNAYNSIR